MTENYLNTSGSLILAMGNKSKGLNAGKKLKLKRKAARWHQRSFIKSALHLKQKSDPLKEAPRQELLF